MKKSFKLIALTSLLVCGTLMSKGLTNVRPEKVEDKLSLIEDKILPIQTNNKIKKIAKNVEEEKALLSIRTGNNAGLRFKYVLNDEQILSSFESINDYTTLTYGILVTKTLGTNSVEELVKNVTLENGKNTINEKVVFNCVAENVLFSSNSAIFAGVLVGFDSLEAYDTYFSTVGYVTDGNKTIYTNEYFASYSYAIEEYLNNKEKYDLTDEQLLELNNIVDSYQISSSFDASEYINKEYNTVITKKDNLIRLESSKVGTSAIYSASKLTANDFTNDYANLTIQLKIKVDNIRHNQLGFAALSEANKLAEVNAILDENEIQSPGIEVTKVEENTYNISLNVFNLFYEALENGKLNLSYIRLQFANNDITKIASVDILGCKISKTLISNMKLDPEINDLSNTFSSHGPTIAKVKEEKYDGNYSVCISNASNSSGSISFNINYQEVIDKVLVFYAKPNSTPSDGYLRFALAFSNGGTRLDKDYNLYIKVTKDHSQTIGTCVEVENGWYKCSVIMSKLASEKTTTATDLRIKIANNDDNSLYVDSMHFVDNEGE